MTQQIKWTGITEGQIRILAMSGNGQFIVTASDKKYIYLFDHSGQMLWKYQTDTEITSVKISADGKFIIVGCDRKTGPLDMGEIVFPLYVFDNSGKQLMKDSRMWGSGACGGWHVAISSDGKYIAGRLYSSIFLFNHEKHSFLNRSGLLWTSSLGYERVNDIAISADGQYMAAGSDQKNIYLFNNAGKTLWKYQTEGFIHCVAISANGQYIIAGSDDHFMYIFNQAGQPLLKLKFPDNIYNVKISPDGKYFLIATMNGYKIGDVYLYNQSGTLLFQRSNSGFVNVSSDWKLISTYSYDDKTLSFIDCAGNEIGKCLDVNPILGSVLTNENYCIAVRTEVQMNTSSFIFIKNEISKIQKSSREIERIEMTPAKKENFDAQKTTETNCKSDRATEILCLIIKNQTVSSISNQSAFTGIIKDYYKGEYKREVTVLVKSIEENIPQDLLAKKDKIPFSVLFAQCVQRLEDCGFSKEMSIWAVHAWARALGIEKF